MPGYNRLIKNVPKLIPIPKEVHTYTPTKGEYAGERFWKCQFGLTLGYSFCIEKIQGASIKHNTFIDIGENEKPGIGYVGFSRNILFENIMVFDIKKEVFKKYMTNGKEILKQLK